MEEEGSENEVKTYKMDTQNHVLLISDQHRVGINEQYWTNTVPSCLRCKI